MPRTAHVIRCASVLAAPGAHAYRVPTLTGRPGRCAVRRAPVLSVRLPALLTPNTRAKLVAIGTDARQGVEHARSHPQTRRAQLRVHRRYRHGRAQRCRTCNRRFWLERKPKERCPSCGGELAETEERRRAIKGGFATRKDCEAALAKVLAALEAQSFTPPTKVTVKQFLTAEWLPTVKGSLRPTTYASYVMLTREHILPRLGLLQLQKLTPAAINALYADLLERAACKARVAFRPPRCAASTPCCTRPAATPCAGGVWRQPGRLRRSAEVRGRRSRQAARLERRAAGRLPCCGRGRPPLRPLASAGRDRHAEGRGARPCVGRSRHGRRLGDHPSRLDPGERRLPSSPNPRAAAAGARSPSIR